MNQRYVVTSVIRAQRKTIGRLLPKVAGLRDEVDQAVAPEIVNDLQAAWEHLTAAGERLLAAETRLSDMRKEWRAVT